MLLIKSIARDVASVVTIFHGYDCAFCYLICFLYAGSTVWFAKYIYFPPYLACCYLAVPMAGCFHILHWFPCPNFLAFHWRLVAWFRFGDPMQCLFAPFARGVCCTVRVAVRYKYKRDHAYRRGLCCSTPVLHSIDIQSHYHGVAQWVG